MERPLILIFDVYEPAREMMSYILNDRGYDVVCAAMPSLDVIQLYRPTVIILELPPTAPSAALLAIHTIQRSRSTRQIPIIASSTSPLLLASMADELARNNCSILEKPFELDDFYASVEQAVSRQANVLTDCRYQDRICLS